MGNFFKQFVKKIATKAGLKICRKEDFDDLENRAILSIEAKRLKSYFQILSQEKQELRSAILASPSQLGQDIFALEMSGWKRSGWFVEFGATDGRTLSNTWLLETQFGWTGILAEPARCWHKALAASGRTAAMETECVWSRSGETLTFHETDYAELSTIGTFAEADFHDRSGASQYVVQTVSLNDMLQRHGAPAEMDYLSIDTEGSEFEILSSLDFARYRFHVITCEHNFTPDRERIHTLLTSQGYTRKLEAISEYDDWYVLEA